MFSFLDGLFCNLNYKFLLFYMMRNPSHGYNFDLVSSSINLIFSYDAGHSEESLALVQVLWNSVFHACLALAWCLCRSILLLMIVYHDSDVELILV